MGFVWPDPGAVLADGEQSAADGAEVQGSYDQGKSAQDPAGVAGGCLRGLSEMAGGAGDVRFLYYRIFAVLKKDHMIYSVEVRVMPLKELLDPQGKAVMGGLQSLGIKNVSDVRIGKSISLQVEAASADEARKVAE